MEDFATQLLKRLYRIYPFENIKRKIKSFRILPNISLNPLNSEVDISFSSMNRADVILEDVLNLVESISKKNNKIIVVFDEFQEIKNINKNLDKYLRAIIQHHQKVNYIFLGSQEHMMQEIFQKKSSPFYHFGYLIFLDKIPFREFHLFLSSRFSKISNNASKISAEILELTNAHPYYTQQLAFTLFEILLKTKNAQSLINRGVEEIIRIHDLDYESLWITLNRTDMKLLIGLTVTETSPLASEFSSISSISSSSTIFSSLKRLTQKGIVIKTKEGYFIDDPFFRRWIIKRRAV